MRRVSARGEGFTRREERVDISNHRKARVLLEKLKHAIEGVQSGEEFQRYLKAMSVFRRYSWSNCLLIAMQKPDATYVAGFRTWQKLKRYVKRGERGIAILAPVIIKQRDEEREEELEVITGFRVVYVFDISQTEGEPLAQAPRDEIRDNFGGVLSKLVAFAEKKGLRVRFEKLRYAEGISGGGDIVIHEERNSTEQAVILIHELAHEMIHWKLESRSSLSKEQKELEAEAVVFLVTEAIGMDNNSEKYLALYYKSYDLLLSFEVIHAVATEILNEICPSGRADLSSNPIQ